jgi:hypothetical protein
MALSRRKFLKAGTLVALAAAIPLSITGVASGQQKSGPHSSPTRGFPIPPESYRSPVTYFRKSTFSPYLNSTFLIRLDAKQSIELTLVRVADSGITEGRASDEAVGKECFSLLFRGANNRLLKQRLYTIEHGALGKFSLFLAPAGKETRGQFYQAVINHRLP